MLTKCLGCENLELFCRVRAKKYLRTPDVLLKHIQHMISYPVGQEIPLSQEHSFVSMLWIVKLKLGVRKS